jgi:type II secretion system protein N
MDGKRKKLLLAAYVVLTGIILLYVLFPANAVRDHLANRINRNISEARVGIGSLGLRFPFSLSLLDVTVSKNESVLFGADRVKISPKWFSLLSSRKAFRFKGKTYQGDFSGSVRTGSNGERMTASASGRFSEIMLGKLPLITNQSRMDLSGILSGSFEIDASTSEPTTGSGEIYVSDCNLVLSDPLLDIQRLLNIEKLEFAKIQADLLFEDGSLEIQNGLFEGTQFSGSVSGTVFFRSPVSRSDLNLEIAVTPLLYSKLSEINELTFRVTGTLENPNFSSVPTQ